MPVRLDAGRIRLEEHCIVEEALPLLEMLRVEPDAAIDLAGCASLHSAVFQTLLAAGRPIAAAPADALLAARLMPLLGPRERAA